MVKQKVIHKTLEEIIFEFGEIPLCSCSECQKNRTRVNIQPYRYNYYKKYGYPKFNRGHNKPMKGHKQSQKQKKMMKESNPMFNEDIKIKISKIMTEYANRPEIKERLSKNSLEYSNRPEVKQAVSNRMSKLMNDPEHKEYMRNISIEYHNRPEIKEIQSKRQKELMKNPEQIEKLIQRNIKNWQDPIYREKQIKRLRERIGKLSSGYGRVPSHDKRFLHISPLQGELSFHTWDYLYALYLESIGKSYLYEMFTFELLLNNKETTYTPDFYLPETDEYIEVKGYWRDDAKEKYDKFKETYPNIKIILLMKQDLQNLGIKL